MILTLSGAPTVSFTVPDGVSAIVAFNSCAFHTDTVGADSLTRVSKAILSADLNLNFSQTAGGNSVKLLAISDSVFPKIPVSAGERLMVAFEDGGSAVIYFDSAE